MPGTALSNDCAAAWSEWESIDAKAWESATADGLSNSS